jgi:dephospho-CoA kinase
MSHKDRRYNEQFRPEFSKLHADRDLRWVVPFSVRYLVAVTGSRFAGKSTALAYLSEKRGFELYSLATTLRETAVELGVPLEPRFRLQDLGDELRAHFGDPAFLARITLRRIHRDHLDQRGTVEPLRRIAVGGFKRLEELRLFEGLGRFQHIKVDASDKIRLKRAVASGVGERELRSIGVDAKLDQESFRRHIDGRDLEGHSYSWTEGFGQAVGELLKAPSKVIPNEGKQADLAAALDEEISRLDKRYRAFSG